jgi:hypothetical protein
VKKTCMIRRKIIVLGIALSVTVLALCNLPGFRKNPIKNKSSAGIPIARRIRTCLRVQKIDLRQFIVPKSVLTDTNTKLRAGPQTSESKS